MANVGKTSAKHLLLAERRALAVELRKQGGSFRDIGKTLRELPEDERAKYGISAVYCEVDAFRDCMAELKRLNKQSLEGIAEVKRLELERLDALLASWWELAGRDPVAFDKVLTLMERRAKYLGLDAPVKQEVTGEVQTVSMTLGEWQAQVAKRRAAAEQAERMALGPADDAPATHE